MQMLRGQIRVIRHTHKCIGRFFACALFHVPAFSLSPAVGKVSKPRRGHPLVESVIGVQMGRFAQDNSYTHACSCIHTRIKG